VSGVKNNNPLSPDYVPSIFDHVKSPDKKKRARDELDKFRRRSEAKRRRLSHGERQELSS